MTLNPYDDSTIHIGFTNLKKGIKKGYLFRSTDGGSNWVQLNSFADTQIEDLAIDPNAPQTILVASNKGILLSRNSGSNWKKVFDTLATCLKISPVDSNKIYAGCYDGVFASYDGGQSWAKISNEQDYPFVHYLEINDSTQTLYASIHEGGLLTYRESEKNMVAILADTGGTTKPEPGIYFYPSQTKIEITAIPDNHYEFEGWEGCKSGKTNPIRVSVDRDMVIKANFYVHLFPPTDFWGEKVVNRSLSMIEYINILRWQRNPLNFQVDKYKIYRIEEEKAVLLAELGSDTFEYWDRNINKDQDHTYALVAVHITGEESDPVYTTFK